MARYEFERTVNSASIRRRWPWILGYTLIGFVVVTLMTGNPIAGVIFALLWPIALIGAFIGGIAWLVFMLVVVGFAIWLIAAAFGD